MKKLFDDVMIVLVVVMFALYGYNIWTAVEQSLSVTEEDYIEWEKERRDRGCEWP